MRAVYAIGFWILFLACQVGQSAQTVATQPRASSASAASANTNPIASFVLQQGFRIDMVAAEQVVAAPTAMAFDENGRLFVAEMRDYPNRRDASPHLGRIRVLRDPEGEGVFTESTVYAEDLAWPSAIACYDGGVFVAAAPDILYVKDTKHDGIADVRRVVFAGFGGRNALNPDLLPNNFNWGLDNRIHGASAGIGGTITRSGSPGIPVSVADSDFSFDPRALTLAPEAGPAQSGSCFDNDGRRFVCGFSSPLRLPMYETRYSARNPFYVRPQLMFDVAPPATPTFRYEAQIPSPPVPTAGTGSPVPGWTAAARGVLIYRGNLLPTDYWGNAFIPDSAAHIIHRAVLRDDGLGVLAERPREERDSEFLLSKDPAFQPVQLISGPDGALYVADLHGGGDAGRIFRIAPAQFRPQKPPALGKATTQQLVATLAHPSGWHRDIAARLLFERRDSAAIPLLVDMLNRSELPQARLQALYALVGLGALAEPHVLKGLRDRDESVRAHSVLLSERLVANSDVSDALWTQLSKLASDPALRVRYQLAFTIGEIHRRDKIPVLGSILTSDLQNPWTYGAVLSSLSEGGGRMFVQLAANPRFRSTAPGQNFLRNLALMVGTSGRSDEVAVVLDFVNRAGLDDFTTFAYLGAVGEGLLRARSSLGLVDPQGLLVRLYSQALTDALDGTVPETTRVEALRFLAVTPTAYTPAGDFLIQLLGSGASPGLQGGVASVMGKWPDLVIATNLLARWTLLNPATRQQAAAALLGRNNREELVVKALEIGLVVSNDLSQVQQNFLRTASTQPLRQRAVKVLGPVPTARPDIVRQFKPALRLRGIAGGGQSIFNARCSACHQYGTQGYALGPGLERARLSGKEAMLNAILEPNVGLGTNYQTSVLYTQTGQNQTGIVSSDNLTTLTLRQPGGVQMVWPRSNVQSIAPQPWSLMPVGLEQGLSLQNMADLLEFLMTGPAPTP
jgi:putative membrane-bound dehydrogenase-like protein